MRALSQIKTAREVPCVQGSPEWLALRSGFISPSKFRTVVAGTERGLNTYLRELREGAKVYGGNLSAATSWGKFHEPEARAQFSLETGFAVRQVGFFVHNELARVGGSPDGLVFAGEKLEAGLEIKCPYDSSVHQRTCSLGMPADHRYQVQGYMWLLGLESWYFVSYDPRAPRRKLFVSLERRDVEFHARIDRRVREFHGVLASDTWVATRESATDVVAAPRMKMFF